MNGAGELCRDVAKAADTNTSGLRLSECDGLLLARHESTAAVIHEAIDLLQGSDRSRMIGLQGRPYVPDPWNEVRRDLDSRACEQIGQPACVVEKDFVRRGEDQRRRETADSGEQR